MSYTALYRKFRPETFAEVKGQEHIVTTLTNQIKADRIGHAYLFCGTRGTGKTSVAKILAKAVNCEHPVDGNPCNTCALCRAINDGSSMNVIEIDAASNNGVDNIREIREEVSYHPTEGRYKVYIIDEVHMLSTGAFNALLKTLEEPPSYVIFILATTEVNKIPVTILSRCQRYDFHRISVDTITDRLRELTEAEQVQAEERALRYIARAADGSMRDALSLLDQCIAFYLGEELTYDRVLDNLGAVDTEVFGQLLRNVVAGDVTGAVLVIEKIVMQGREMGQFVTDFIWYLRNLLLLKTSEDPGSVIDVSSENLGLMQEEALLVNSETLMRYIRVMSELSGQMRYSSQKRVLVEVAVIKLCRPAMETNLDSVLDRVRVLEEKLNDGTYLQQTDQDQESEETKKAEQPKDREAPIAEEEKPVVPEQAAPEDLSQVMEQWRGIVGETKGLLKTLLQQAIPKYDSQAEDAVLYIAFTNQLLGPAYVDNEEYRENLQEIIRRRTGKTVEIRFLMEDQGQDTELSQLSIDDMIKQNIHMDIVMEDE